MPETADGWTDRHGKLARYETLSIMRLVVMSSTCSHLAA